MKEYPEKPTALAVLMSSTLLNSMSEEETHRLADVSHLAFVARGDTVWGHGRDVDFFGVVGTGFVKMVRSCSNGHDVTTEIIGPGQVFGLLGVIEGVGCPQSAKAVCPTWYLRVSKASFMPYYHGNVVLKEQLVRRTTSRLRSAYLAIARLSTAKVEGLVASVLLLLAESYGIEVKSGLAIAVPLTRQDIGEMAGTTTETTIRVMSRWQKHGWISTRGKTVVLRDIPALEALMT